MTFGLTPEGLFVPRLPDLRTEIDQELLGLFGAAIDVSDESVEGQVIGILSERFALIWELLEILHGAVDSKKASKALLDALCALTGTLRAPATYSVVPVILTGAPATVVPGGSQCSTGVESGRFLTVGDAELVAAPAWAAITYPAGSIVTSSGQIYWTLNGAADTVGQPAHTSRLGVPAPGTPAEFWFWLGTGTAYVEKLCRAAVTGPVFAPGVSIFGGDISVIDTPIGGWQGVANLVDVTAGRDQAEDEELRVAREAELAAQGTSPVDSLRGRLLRLEGVEAVTVFFNNTDQPDADGLPPHSIEALVQGGEDDEIRALLWASVAAGIRTHGTTSGTITDSQGRLQTIKFSRPTEIPIYVELEVEIDPLVFPADGVDQIKAAIVAFGATQESGDDARSFAIAASSLAVDGVLTVLDVDIGIAPSPTLPNTIPISLRERATFALANVTVVTTDGVP